MQIKVLIQLRRQPSQAAVFAARKDTRLPVQSFPFIAVSIAGVGGGLVGVGAVLVGVGVVLAGVGGNSIEIDRTQQFIK